MVLCVCVMATDFLELATTLKYLGAKWLPGKNVNFMPCSQVSYSMWPLLAVQHSNNETTLHYTHKLPSLKIHFSTLNLILRRGHCCKAKI